MVCNRIPHPNCFLISKTVKFSTKALPNSVPSGVMKGSTSKVPQLRCFCSWGFITAGSKREQASHPKTTFIARRRSSTWYLSDRAPLAPRTPPLIMVDVKTSEYLVFSI